MSSKNTVRLESVPSKGVYTYLLPKHLREIVTDYYDGKTLAAISDARGIDVAEVNSVLSQLCKLGAIEIREHRNVSLDRIVLPPRPHGDPKDDPKREVPV